MAVIFALWMRNLRAFVRNRTALIINLVFPFFFLFIFAEVFRIDNIENPVTFMLAGIIIATVFDSSLRMASSTINDMTSGFMKEVLVSPISRVTIAIGQFLAAATVATLQGMLIFAAGFAVGLRISSPLTVLWVILAMILVGLVFAGFGLFIATKAKNIQTFQSISLALTMPMSFISGAYIPFAMLPEPLVWVGRFNPLTYAVAFFRTIVLERFDAPIDELVLGELAIDIQGFIISPMGAAGVLLIFGALFLVLSTHSFMRVDFSKMSRNAGDSMMEDVV